MSSPAQLDYLIVFPSQRRINPDVRFAMNITKKRFHIQPPFPSKSVQTCP